MMPGDRLEPGGEALGLRTGRLPARSRKKPRIGRRGLGRDQIGEAGEGRQLPPAQHQGRGQLAHGEAPLGDRDRAQRPHRPDIQPGLAGQASRARARHRPGTAPGTPPAAAHRPRGRAAAAEPHLRPAGDGVDGAVPAAHRALPGIERVVDGSCPRTRRGRSARSPPGRPPPVRCPRPSTSASAATGSPARSGRAGRPSSAAQAGASGCRRRPGMIASR